MEEAEGRGGGWERSRIGETVGGTVEERKGSFEKQ